MDEIDTRAFIKEREDKLGAKIIWKTYSTFFAEVSGEKREYGVFVYSDGKSVNIEDFERVPSIMGIALPGKKNKEKYIKLEISFAIDDISSITLITKSSAISSFSTIEDKTKESNLFDRLLRKQVTCIKLLNGRIFFLELISHKEFLAFIKQHNENIK